MAEHISNDEIVVLSDKSINSNVFTKGYKRKKEKVSTMDHFVSFVDENRNKKRNCKHSGQDYFANSVKNGTKAMLTHILACTKMQKVVDKCQTQICFQSEHLVSNYSYKFL